METLIHSDEFWVSIAFVLFLIAIWRPAQARLATTLDARIAAVKAELDQAQELREAAMSALAECQRKQQEALQQAEQIVTVARAEAERAAEEAHRELAAALERRRRLAADRIKLEEEKAVADVRDLVVDIAVEAAAQILSRGLDEPRRAELIEQTVRALPRQLH
jgi:F-type H+-transporting ATPase subunit b